MSLLFTVALGCSVSGPQNGKLTCAAGAHPCPDGYYCHAGSNTCWKNGSGPDGSAPAGQDGAGLDGPKTDGGQPDGGDTTRLDGAGAAEAAQDVAAATEVTPEVAPEVTADAPADAQPDEATVPDVVARDVADARPDVPTVQPEAGTCPSGKVNCNGRCVDPPPAGCCTATDCAGACMTCGASNTCTPLVSKDDPTARCAGTCDATGACRSKQGQACTTVGGGCASGLFCSPEGLCCDKECKGSCEACDLTGSLGTCKTLAANASPHLNHTACTGQGVCVGKCDGTSPSCVFPTGACGTAGCSTSGYQATGTCGGGTCTMPAVQPCTYTCDVAAGCTGVCKPDALQCSATSRPQKCNAAGAWVDQTPCGTGYTCQLGVCNCLSPKQACNGACIDVQSDGKNCGGCDHDCLGGTCSGGKCQPVVVASGLSTQVDLFGIDGQSLYYQVPDVGPGNSAYRIAKTAQAATGTLLVANYGYTAFHGVMGGSLLLINNRMATSYICSFSPTNTCPSAGEGYPPAIETAGYLVPWGSVAPAQFALRDTMDGLAITWLTPGLATVASYADNTSGVTYGDFYQYGSTVYFTRPSNNTASLHAVSSGSASTVVDVSSGFPASALIADANAQSVLLWYGTQAVGALYRVPVQGATSTETPLATFAWGTPGMQGAATEDASYAYWIEGGGTLNRCAPSSCTPAPLTTGCGQNVLGPLLQDATALYWTDAGQGRILKLAK